MLSRLLQKQKIPHEVLNAKQHEREATIVAQAGRPGAVTIATNMAGRGTDIVLGGNLEAELHQIDAADEVTPSTRSRGMAEAPRRGASKAVVCISSVPNATSRDASTISCAAVQAARAIRVRVASICRSKTI